MIKKDSVGGATVVVRDASGLDCYGLEKHFLVGEANETEALLDGSFESGAVVANVAEELGKLSRLEDEFT